MPIVKANGINLYYEDNGPADAPVILLVMGLGAQMIAWPDEFVQGLVAKGFRVIRYDNRDVGLSTRFDASQRKPTTTVVERSTRNVEAHRQFTVSAVRAFVHAVGRAHHHDLVALLPGIDHVEHVAGAGGEPAQLAGLPVPGHGFLTV